MKIEKTYIKGLALITPDLFKDARGYFLESYNQKRYQEVLPDMPPFVQTNISKSSYGVVRGLHFQRPPHAQAKLVSVIKGKVLDVAVDLRPGSETFGRYFSVELSEENHLQFFIPEGFAHGFSVLSEEVIFEYKCSALYNKESEGGILWNDGDIAIDWRVDMKDVILSDKDANNPTFRQFCKELELRQND